jgi:hypothetical protein
VNCRQLFPNKIGEELPVIRPEASERAVFVQSPQ